MAFSIVQQAQSPIASLVHSSSILFISMFIFFLGVGAVKFPFFPDSLMTPMFLLFGFLEIHTLPPQINSLPLPPTPKVTIYLQGGAGLPQAEVLGATSTALPFQSS